MPERILYVKRNKRVKKDCGNLNPNIKEVSENRSLLFEGSFTMAELSIVAKLLFAEGF